MKPWLLICLLLVGCSKSTPKPKVDTVPDAAGKPCDTSQCATIKQKSGGYCGDTNPYGCVSTGGCYPTAEAAQAGCANNWCLAENCSRLPQPQRAIRKVQFHNNCGESIDIWLTDPSPATNPHPFCPKEDGGVQPPRCSVLTVGKQSTANYDVSLVEGKNKQGDTYYYLPAGGIVFWAMPDDGDFANTTLFEINFGANGGVGDVYDLSAIPPGSCAGHIKSTENDLGYADHLPYKDPKDPTMSWACLKLPDGGVDPKTCGDGQGWKVCPAVKVDGGTLTTTALTAVKGTTKSGCGVPGEKCCGYPAEAGVACSPTTETSCCPQVCAVMPNEDATDPKVRSRVYRCAHLQGVATAIKPAPGKVAPRQTGYWKSMKIEPVWLPGQTQDSSCQTKTCNVPTGTDISQIGTTCQGYLWPYDDATALVNCNAIPDYKVTLCP